MLNSRYYITVFGLIIILQTTFQRLYSQNSSNKGNDFWVAYMGHIDGTGSNMSLYITSDVSTSGTVSIPGKSWNTNFTVTSNSVTVVSIPQSLAYMNCSDCILSQGIHITSNSDVVVYAHIYANARSDATLVLPTQTAGRDYYTMSFTQKVTGSNRQNEFLVIGLEDSTYVDITPTAGTLSGTHSKGVKYTKMLNKGQVYQIQSDSDLTASKISSYGTNTSTCKRIAVFSGSSFTPLGCTSASSGDNLFQQIYPVSAWGKIFVTAPFKTRYGGDYFRVLASVNSTKVTINGWNTQTLNAGQYYEWLNDSAQYISSTQPILLAQFQRTQNCDNVTGDPSMTILNPIEQKLNDITLYSSPYQNITGNYINILMESDDTSSFYIDNTKPVWKLIPKNNIYAYAQQTVSSGNHHLYADSGFNAIAYGFGNVESYGYSAGANITNLVLNITLKYGSATATCLSEPVYFKGNCAYTPIAWKWYFGDGATDTNQNTQHTYSDTGTYTASLVTTKSNGNDCDSKDSVIYNVKIYPNPEARISFQDNCDNESVKFYDSSYTNSLSTLTRSWQFGDSSGSSNQKNPTYAYAKAGTYLVIFTMKTTGNCASTDSSYITIYQAPQAGFIWTDSCITDSIELFDTSIIQSSSCFKNYIIWGDGKTDSFSNNPYHNLHHHQYNNGNNYAVKYIIRDCNIGCADTFTNPIKLNSIPNSSFTVSGNCENFETNFKDTSSINYGTISQIKYLFGDGNDTTISVYNQTINHVYKDSGWYKINLIVMNGNSCQDTISQSYYINSNPVADFFVKDVCYPDTVIIYDSSYSKHGNIDSVKYTFGDGSFVTVYSSASVKHYYNSAGTYQIYQYVYSQTGCWDSVSKTITVQSKPNAFYTFSNTCQYDSVTFTNSSSGSKIISTLLFFGNGDSAYFSGSKLKYKYSTYDSLTTRLIITTSAGCSDTTDKLLVIYPAPHAQFSVKGNCSSDSIRFYDSSYTGRGSINKWTWNWPDNSTNSYTSYRTYVSHLFSDSVSGNSSLVVNNNYNCKDTFINTLVINKKPGISIQVENLCTNTSVDFIPIIQMQGREPYNFRLITGNGDSITGGDPDTLSYFYGKYGNYTFTYFLTDSVGCADTIQSTILIDTIPTLFVTYDSVCAKTPIHFQINSSVYNGLTSFITTRLDSIGPDTLYSGWSSILYTFDTGGYHSTQIVSSSTAGCSDTFITEIYIYPLPQAQITLPNVCYKDSVMFSDISSIDSGTITLWNIFYGDGDSTIHYSSDVYKHKYDTSGIYTVKLITESQWGCKDTFQNNFTVNAGPHAVIGMNKPCINEGVKFYDSTWINVGNVFQWNWMFGDGKTDTIKNPMHLYNSTGNYAVKLLVKSGNLCVDSITKNITIYNSPIASFSVNSHCFGDTVTFVSSSTAVSGSMDSVFYYKDTTLLISNTGNLSTAYLFNKDTIYNIRYIARNSYTCTDTAYKTIEVYPLPNFNVIPNNVCRYDSTYILFNAITPKDSLQSVQFNWSSTDSQIVTLIPDTVRHFYSQAGYYPVIVKVLTQHNCSLTDYIPVYIHEKPAATIYETDTQYCINSQNFIFTDSTQFNGNIQMRKWKISDGTDTLIASFKHNFALEGNYTVTLILQSDSGCFDTATQNIYVYPLPNVGFSINNDSQCLKNNLYIFTDTASISSGNYTTHWKISDTMLFAGKVLNYTFNQRGNYTIMQILQSNHLCTDSLIYPLYVKSRPEFKTSVKNICLYDSALFTDTITIKQEDIKFSYWNLGDGTEIYDTGSVSLFYHKYFQDTTYSFFHIAESKLGCRDTFQGILYIYPVPKTDFSFINACEYDSIRFIDLSTIDNGKIDHSIWNFGNGNYDSVNYLYNKNGFLYRSDGVYTVTLHSISDSGCYNDISHKVEVFDQPLLYFKTNDQCLGTVTYPVESAMVMNAKIFKYYHDWGDGQKDSSVFWGQSHQYNHEGVYYITTMVKSDKNCFDTLIDTIDIHPLPQVNLDVNGNCVKDSAIFKDLSSIVRDTLIQNKWITGDGYIYTNNYPTQPLSHKFTMYGIYTIQLLSWSNAGCVDSAYDTVHILPSPHAKFFAKESCFPDPVSIQEKSWIDSGTIIRYLFSLGDGTILDTGRSPIEFVKNYYDSGLYKIYLVVSSSLGCTDTSVQNVIVHPLPIAKYQINNKVGCMPFDVKFINLSRGFRDPIISSDWKFGDGETDTAFNPIHRLRNEGIYNTRLMVTTDAGCTQSYQDTIPVVVNELPVSQFELSPEKVTTLTYRAHFVNTSISAEQYLWNFGDGKISQDKNPTNIYSDTGTYIVQLVAVNHYGCKDTSYRLQSVIPAVSLHFVNSFTPNDDDLNETWGPEGISDGIRLFHLDIYNRWGEKVFEADDKNERWNGRNLNIGKECSSDVYVYRISYTDWGYKKHTRQGTIQLLR